MVIEFDVKMTTQAMYDYMLYHTFRSFSGILGEAVGVLLLAGFFVSKSPLYLIAGLIVILYQPVALYFNAKKQVTLNPAFKNDLHFKLDETGVTVTVLEESESQEWKDMYKAVSTSKSIILYTNKASASIFPRTVLKEKEIDVIKMISTHMDPKKVNIKV